MILKLLLTLCVIILYSGCARVHPFRACDVKLIPVDRPVEVSVPTPCVQDQDCGILATDSDAVIAAKYYSCTMNFKEAVAECRSE